MSDSRENYESRRDLPELSPLQRKLLREYPEVGDLILRNTSEGNMAFETYSRLDDAHVRELFDSLLLGSSNIRKLIFPSSTGIQPVMTLEEYSRLSKLHILDLNLNNSRIRDLIQTKRITVEEYSTLTGSQIIFLSHFTVRNLFFPEDKSQRPITFGEFSELNYSQIKQLTDPFTQQLIFPEDKTQRWMTIEQYSSLSASHIANLYDTSIRDLIQTKRITVEEYISLSIDKMFELRKNQDIQNLVFPDDPTMPRIPFNQFLALKDKEIEEKSFIFNNNTEINRYILQENTGKFIDYLKIASFFFLVQKNPENIKSLLAMIKPDHIKNDLNKILRRMSGYNVMPDYKENLTIGVEIEYTNIPRKQKKMLEYLMNIIQPGWNHPGDESVDYSLDCYGGEATTPIIHNNEELRQAMLNVAFLQSMGAKVNDTCGLHVHIGVLNIKTPPQFAEIDNVIGTSSFNYTTYQFEFIKQFLIIYQREKVKFKQVERRHTSYAKEINDTNIKNIDKLQIPVDEINQKNRGYRDRYYEVNLHSLRKHGTIEIRRFAGTTEEPEIYATISMIEAMAQEAKLTTNHIFINKLSDKKKKSANDEKIESTSETKKISADSTESSKTDLLFFRQNTSQQRELFTLRVKPLLESKLEVVDTKSVFDSAKEPQTIYIRLVDNNIEYKAINQYGESKKSLLEYEEKFKEIIQKLQSHEPLNKQEENIILLEIAQRNHAVVSKLVEKIKPILKPKIQPKLAKK